LITIFASLLGGATLAWVENAASNQSKGNEQSLSERLKQAENKLYLDGMKRANEISEIKREVNMKVAQ